MNDVTSIKTNDAAKSGSSVEEAEQDLERLINDEKQVDAEPTKQPKVQSHAATTDKDRFTPKDPESTEEPVPLTWSKLAGDIINAANEKKFEEVLTTDKSFRNWETVITSLEKKGLEFSDTGATGSGKRAVTTAVLTYLSEPGSEVNTSQLSELVDQGVVNYQKGKLHVDFTKAEPERLGRFVHNLQRLPQGESGSSYLMDLAAPIGRASAN
ncbi:hypothetical protein FEE96_22850 [Parasedimentitalea maritima]|uniref:Uncharacterized protein n=1 Tax=Parasedimentitalea maritima TaxID=2578117 RepID=A0ABY2UND2_9RHOB|nr:hypothetical protein [Zongyanglinia marina]TLP55315.1 hypothetical protein FEE96_22850 [Zongyanglinia marina]